MKKIVSMILFITMVVTLIQTNVFAQEQNEKTDYKKIYTDFIENTTIFETGYPTSGLMMMDMNSDDVPELLSYASSAAFFDKDGNMVLINQMTKEDFDILEYRAYQHDLICGFSIVDGEVIDETPWELENGVYRPIYMGYLPDESGEGEESFESMFVYENEQRFVTDAKLTSGKMVEFSEVWYDDEGHHCSHNNVMGHYAFFSTYANVNVPVACVSYYIDEEKRLMSKSETLQVLFEEYEKAVNASNSKNQIILTIGNKTAIAFDEIKTNDVAPIIRNDRTMLPARFVAEKLGAKVNWDEEKREVTISKEGTVIVIKVDSSTATVNGKKVTLDSPAFIENDRTYTPVRFIVENLGASVEWNESTQEVTITKQQPIKIHIIRLIRFRVI